MTAEDILLSKSWDELNSDEKMLVKDLAADEASFNHMKQFMQQVGQLSSHTHYEPSVSVKTRLDNVFANQHAGRLQTSDPVRIPSVKSVPLYQRNWTKIAAAAVFVLTAVLVWTWPGRQKIAPATTIAKVEEPIVFSDWNPAAEEKEDVGTETKTPDVPFSELAPKSEKELMNSAKSVLEKSAETLAAYPSTVTAETYSVQFNDEQAMSSKIVAKTGLTADLFPNSCPNSVGASSEELLSYIKPAF